MIYALSCLDRSTASGQGVTRASLSAGCSLQTSRLGFEAAPDSDFRKVFVMGLVLIQYFSFATFETP